MNEQDKRALEIWASTTSAPLAKGIIIDFARRIRRECAKGEPVSRIYPCGCVLCICCDGDEKCYGCGAKSCGKSDAECDWKQERIKAVRFASPQPSTDDVIEACLQILAQFEADAQDENEGVAVTYLRAAMARICVMKGNQIAAGQAQDQMPVGISPEPAPAATTQIVAEQERRCGERRTIDYLTTTPWEHPLRRRYKVRRKQIAAGQLSGGTSAGHTRPVAVEPAPAATTPTPRTDALLEEWNQSLTVRILLKACRKLERELQAANAERDRLAQVGINIEAGLREDLDKANAQIETERKSHDKALVRCEAEVFRLAELLRKADPNWGSPMHLNRGKK